MRHDLGGKEFEVLVHFRDRIAGRDGPGVKALDGHGGYIVLDHLYCRFRRDDIQNATGFERSLVFQVWK